MDLAILDGFSKLPPVYSFMNLDSLLLENRSLEDGWSMGDIVYFQYSNDAEKRSWDGETLGRDDRKA